MADVRQDELIFSDNAFAAIELRGVVYFVHAAAASQIKAKLNEEIIWNAHAPRIQEFLTGVSAFAIDFDNGKVLKPTK
jgi:hypothetical protein